MERSYDQTLLFEMPGYWDRTVIIERRASSSLWRNIIWIHPIGWIIGVVFDLHSGSGYDLEPESVSVELVRHPLAAEGVLERDDGDMIRCKDGSIYIGHTPEDACPDDP